MRREVEGRSKRGIWRNWCSGRRQGRWLGNRTIPCRVGRRTGAFIGKLGAIDVKRFRVGSVGNIAGPFAQRTSSLRVRSVADDFQMQMRIIVKFEGLVVLSARDFPNDLAGLDFGVYRRHSVCSQVTIEGVNWPSRSLSLHNYGHTVACNEATPEDLAGIHGRHLGSRRGGVVGAA